MAGGGTYFNPNNMFDTAYKPSGALGGYLAGLNGSYSINTAERGFRDSDLAYQMEEMKRAEEEKNIPLKEIERQLKTREMNTKIGQYDDGTQGRVQRDILEGQGAQGQMLQTQNRMKKAEEAATYWSDFAQSIQTQEPAALDSTFWDTWKARGEAAGIKMPATFGTKEIQQVLAKGKAAANDLPTIRARAAEEQKQSGAMALGRQGNQAAMDRTLVTEAGQNYRTQLTQTNSNERTKMMADAARQRTAARDSLENLKAKAFKGELPAAVIESLVPAWIEEDYKDFVRDAGGLESVNPERAAATMAQITKKYTDLLVKAKGAGGGTDAPTAKADSAVPNVSSQAEYDKLPVGAKYMYNGKEMTKKAK